MKQQDFVTTYSGLANDVSQQTGLDPNIVMGLVAHETGWGDHVMGSNIFGVMQPGTQQIKPYPDVGAATDDFISLINRRYAPAAQQTTPAGQAAALVQLGYNRDDPGYAHHISLNAAHIGQIVASSKGGGTDGGATAPAPASTDQPPAPSQGPTTQYAGPGVPAGGDDAAAREALIKRYQQPAPGTAGAGASPQTPQDTPKTDTPPPPAPPSYPPGSVGEAIDKANQQLPSFLQPPPSGTVAGNVVPMRYNQSTGEHSFAVPEMIRSPAAGVYKAFTGAQSPLVMTQDPDVANAITTTAGFSGKAPGFAANPNPLVAPAEKPPVPPVEGATAKPSASTPPPTGGTGGPFQPKQADVTGYQTEKGSTYQIQPDGTTIRNKAPRQEHPGDSGIKPASEMTVYVDKDGLNKLAPPSDTDWRYVPSEDGSTMSLLTRRDDGTWGVAPSQMNVPVSKTPALGMHPIELFKRNDVTLGKDSYPGYSSSHAGNQITRLSRDPNPDFTPNQAAGAEPNPTPQQPPPGASTAGAQGGNTPTQAQIDQLVTDTMRKFRDIQQKNGAGFLRNMGGLEISDVVKGVLGMGAKIFAAPVPGVGLIADTMVNAASSYFRNKRINRSLDGLEQQLRDNLSNLHGGGEGTPPGGTGTGAPGTGGAPNIPTITVRPIPTGRFTRSTTGDIVSNNSNMQNRLQVPRGADMRNRLIYKQAR